MKLREFVRVPMVNDWAKFAVQVSKDETPTPLLTVGLLFILGYLSRVHLATLKIHSVSQTSPNFEQMTSPDVVNNSENKATSRENPVPICISRDASMEHLLASRYRAIWGFTVRKKSGQWRAVWGQVGWVLIVGNISIIHCKTGKIRKYNSCLLQDRNGQKVYTSLTASAKQEDQKM